MSEDQGGIAADDTPGSDPLGDVHDQRASRLAKVIDLLSHPLLLLLVGAAISSVLLPWLTHQWQNHEKELEIKSILVQDINETVTDFVVAVQLAEVGAKSQTQEEFDKAYVDWEVKKRQLASRIRVYFPNSGIADDWDRYSKVVTDFYVLSGVYNESARTNMLRNFTEYFPGG